MHSDFYLLGFLCDISTGSPIGHLNYCVMNLLSYSHREYQFKYERKFGKHSGSRGHASVLLVLSAKLKVECDFKFLNSNPSDLKTF